VDLDLADSRFLAGPGRYSCDPFGRLAAICLIVHNTYHAVLPESDAGLIILRQRSGIVSLTRMLSVAGMVGS